MSQPIRFVADLPDTSWLYLAEFIHRINNEYSTSISLASNAAARSSSQETRDALKHIADHLHSCAGVHRVMRPSLSRTPANLTEHLTQLCAAMSCAGLKDRGISVQLLSHEPVSTDEAVCWRVGLLVGELITNASRHAFSTAGGSIKVSLSRDSEVIICSVIDDGSAKTRFEPGLGTRLVDALAAELGGSVYRRSGDAGTGVWVSFPAIGGPIMEMEPDISDVHQLDGAG